MLSPSFFAAEVEELVYGYIFRLCVPESLLRLLSRPFLPGYDDRRFFLFCDPGRLCCNCCSRLSLAEIPSNLSYLMPQASNNSMYALKFLGHLLALGFDQHFHLFLEKVAVKIHSISSRSSVFHAFHLFQSWKFSFMNSTITLFPAKPYASSALETCSSLMHMSPMAFSFSLSPASSKALMAYSYSFSSTHLFPSSTSLAL